MLILKHMNRYIQFFCLMLMPPLLMCAGDIPSDLKKMNQAYTAARSFSMKVEIQLYSTAADAKPQVVQKGEVKKQGDNYFSRMEGRINIKKGMEMVFVDENSKTMLVGILSEQDGHEELMAYDSVLNWEKEKMKYLVNTPDLKKIVYSNEEDEQYEKIELSINARTNLLTEVVYYLHKEKTEAGDDSEDYTFGKIVIRYNDVQLNQPVPESAFSTKEYYSSAKGKLSGMGKYKAYKIVDQRNQKVEFK